jgi:2-keto-3-deoxy-6-phosphogluconate aldolase
MSDKAGVIQTIRDIGIIPVVRAKSADEAMKAIDAIREAEFDTGDSR